MEDFKRNTLGVMTASVDLTTALASGVQGRLFGGFVQQPLSYPYPNYDDALAPQPDAQVVLVGDHGWPVALARDMGISKTLFMAFGFEGRPAARTGCAGSRDWLFIAPRPLKRKTGSGVGAARRCDHDHDRRHE
jgi:hypothetical protein